MNTIINSSTFISIMNFVSFDKKCKRKIDKKIFGIERNLIKKISARVNKAKIDLEATLEMYRRERRPGTGQAINKTLRCADFKRLKGIEHLEFFCSVCAEVWSCNTLSTNYYLKLPYGSTIESCRHDFGEHCYISRVENQKIRDKISQNRLIRRMLYQHMQRGRSHSSFLIRANSPEDSFEK